MSFTRVPERWSAVCDGCGFTVDGLLSPTTPQDWTNLKHWGPQVKRDNAICPVCAKSVEKAIEDTFTAARQGE